MVRICEMCGTEFDGKRRSRYCPECRKKRDLESKYRYAARKKEESAENPKEKQTLPDIRLCQMCGREFEGHTSAKYCPECRKLRRSEYLRCRYEQKKAESTSHEASDPVVVALQNASAIAALQVEKEVHKGLVLRRCKQCGSNYWTKPGDSYLCPACAEKKRKDGVRINRTCDMCGVTFLGFPRSKYCPDCAIVAKAEASKRCKERKLAGKTRSIGSTDICQRCGKPYTVTGGLQRYCPDCAKDATAENCRQHKKEYMAENREYFNALHQEARKGRRVCVICGKTFDSPTRTTVCSADCAAEQMRRTRAKANVNSGRAKPVRLLGPRGPINPQSGIPGVHYHPGTGKWELVVNGQYCGLYDTVALAAAAKEEILKIDKEFDDEKSN